MYTTVINKHYSNRYDVYIGRGSKWGNPFIIGKHGNREEVIELYRQYVLGNPELRNSIPELKGKVLGCFCKPAPCHGDILAKLANGELPMYKKLSIGIDQSYQRTGISIAADNKLLVVRSINFPGCKNKIEKRLYITEKLSKILKTNRGKAEEMLILVERIRTFSQGPKQEQGFGLRPDYLKATGALIGTIVDTAYQYNIPVYSVDTRSWKSKILGNSKTDAVKYKSFEKPEKAAAILFVQNKGFDVAMRNKDGSLKIHKKGKNEGKVYYDDDAADSACIALYAFVNKQNLKLEE